MGSSYSLKVDAYAHISPPRYTEVLKKDYPGFYNGILSKRRPLFDLEERFRTMDLFPDVVQVLTVGPVPPLEAFADPVRAVDLAKLANDEMAELVRTHRDRFVAAIALLPMNNMEEALKEADRAIMDLGFKGIYVHSNINGKPLDSEEFLPLYEKMARYNLPIYIHPWRSDSFADYQTEEKTKYSLVDIFGWPYETTLAMSRLVFSGIMEKYPGLKVITHHGGGMVSFYEQRIHQHTGSAAMGANAGYLRALPKTPLDYYRMFYADTAIEGNTPALMLAYNFWGAGHMVFGADMPLGDHYQGRRSYRQVINAIEAMDITEAEKKQIFAENALSLLRLPV